MSVKREWIAPLALLFVSFIWGATFVVVQNAMSFVGAFTFNGIRFYSLELFYYSFKLFSHRKLQNKN